MSHPQTRKKESKTAHRRRMFMAALAGLLALLMLLPIITMILPTASASTVGDLQSAISKGKDRTKELEGQIKALETEIASLKNDAAKAQERKGLLDQQIAAQNEKIAAVEATIDDYNALIAGLDTLIAEKEGEIAQTRAKEEEQFDLFCRRVRAMEEGGAVTYWDVLFSAKDFTDFIDQAVMVGEIMEYDNAVIDALQETRAQLERQQAELEDTRAQQTAARDEQEAAKAALEAEKTVLDGQLAESIALVRSIESSKADAEAKQAALEAEADQIAEDIKKKQKELEQKLSAGQVTFDASSGWLWPIAGHYTVTSLFAMRRHPITGAYGHHTGTDIAAPNGTPIKAAANGVVIISVRGVSYGNYVVIQHQSGIQTLYAHMSSRAVSEGQVVNQGDVIGYVGSTGSSTGNHLHLEFRVNGVRKDALAYYPSINFDLSRCG